MKLTCYHCNERHEYGRQNLDNIICPNCNSQIGASRPSKENPYLVHDITDGEIAYFKDQEQQQRYAEYLVKQYQSSDGWEFDTDEKDQIIMGIVQKTLVKQTIVKREDVTINEEGIDEEGRYWDSDWTEYCDYVFKSIAPQAFKND